MKGWDHDPVNYDRGVDGPFNPASGTLPAGAGPLPDPYTPGHGSADYRVSRYALHLDYRVATNFLSAQVTISATAEAPLTSVLLNLSGLRVLKVRVDGGRPARFIQRAGRLVVNLAKPIPAGQDFTVEVRYEGRPGPLRGNWDEVGWEELTDGVLVAGQPTGAPSWFPCNDHPSRKASFGFTVTTDANYRVVCNGSLIARQAKASRETWVYEQAEPMATYLATVQIGRYALEPLPLATGESARGSAIDQAADSVPQYVAAPVKLLAAARAGLAHQDLMMRTFVRLFGPFPFPTYTVVIPDDKLEIPLEAQSLSIIGPNHLDQTWNSQRLIAHELAHQWFGNSVTAQSWKDIWLHEGFACYAEWLWSEASGNGTAEARATAAHRMLATLPQDLPVGDPGPELMFDDRVYKRGALALHALRTSLGDGPFFDMLKAWAARNRYGSVRTEDLTALVDELRPPSPGQEAASILGPWLYARGLPPL